jgi:hypothetical protein
METYLSNTALAAFIVWENIQSSPTSPQIFWRVRFDAAPRTIILGQDAPQAWNGSLRIAVCAPLDTGPQQIDQSIDLLMARFKAGTLITNGNIKILCRTIARGLAANEGAWFVIPLNITWFSITGE